MRDLKLADMRNLRALPEAEGDLARLVFFNEDPSRPLAVDALALREVWLQAGLPQQHLLRPPGVKDCLTRAVTAVRSSRLAADRLKGAITGYQFTIREADEDERKLSYDPQFSIWLNDLDRLETNASTEQHTAISDLVFHEFEERRRFVAPGLVRTWMQEQVQRLAGLKVASHGHSYYVPATSTAELRRIADVLKSISGHVMATIPVGGSDEMVEVVLAGLGAETARILSAAEAVLRPAEGPVGAMAARTQIRTLEAHLLRVEHYAKLLGTNLDEYQTGARELQRALCIAMVNTDEERGKQKSIDDIAEEFPHMSNLLDAELEALYAS